LAQAQKGTQNDISVSEGQFESLLLRSITEDSTLQLEADGGFQYRHAHRARSLPTWTVRPDLILRTSGEQRLSNFMLYQAAYSEFFFVDKAWPAMQELDLQNVVDEFCVRTRRFGK
jgi:undecaprenyl diphosphate synthase